MLFFNPLSLILVLTALVFTPVSYIASAREISILFGTLMGNHILSEGHSRRRIIKASALKMCYATYTKGTTALLCGILATAQVLGVRGELETQWSRDWPNFGAQAGERVQDVTAKAWRFAGEMAEIAATFREAGMPGEFHTAAEMIYRRIAGFKDALSRPALEVVLEKLIQTPD